MKSILFMVVLLGIACGDTQLCQLESPVATHSRKIWKKKRIVPCWDNFSYEARHEEHRETMRLSIENTWNDALSPPEVPSSEWIQFAGWERCDEIDEYDFSIVNHWGRTYVDGIGTDIEEMRVNFFELGTTHIWVLKRIAAHEFGHVLGIAHEQNRKDTPEWCGIEPQGPSPDTYWGEWDEQSIMNYCRRRGPDLDAHELSDADKFWIKRVYYPQYFDDFECEDL